MIFWKGCSCFLATRALLRGTSQASDDPLAILSEAPRGKGRRRPGAVAARSAHAALAAVAAGDLLDVFETGLAAANGANAAAAPPVPGVQEEWRLHTAPRAARGKNAPRKRPLRGEEPEVKSDSPDIDVEMGDDVLDLLEGGRDTFASLAGDDDAVAGPCAAAELASSACSDIDGEDPGESPEALGSEESPEEQALLRLAAEGDGEDLSAATPPVAAPSPFPSSALGLAASPGPERASSGASSSNGCRPAQTGAN